MSDIRVAVASRSFSRHPVLRAELTAQFPNVTFNDAGSSLAGAELISYLDGHDRAVTALERLDENLFAALPGLRVVAKYGVGLDMIDLDAMARHGVKLGWTPGVNRRAVSELVIAFAISLMRFVPEVNDEVKSGTWRQKIGRQLTGRTVGIIGCGHVGKDLIRLLRTFDCRVLAHDIQAFPEFYTEHGVEVASLEDLLAEAEIVTLHVPLDPSTRNLISRERLQLMRSDAVLLNIARGGLVDESALKNALINGQLAAAGFDVFATEPPEDPELLNLTNFLATPHIGGSSEEAVLAMGRAAIRGLSEFGDPHAVSTGQGT